MLDDNSIMTEMEKAKKKVEFPDEGVTFYFPEELKHLVVCNLKEPSPYPCKPTDDFEPKYFVINFDLGECKEEGSVTRKEFKFDKPFIFEVKIKDKVLREAGIDLEELQLGFCYDGEWILKKDTALEIHYKNTDWDRAWLIPIQSSKDPLVAWGP
jgi:hypothetical protein